jgi:hypothetical protein
MRVEGRVPADPQAVRQTRTILLRRTDRRPVTGSPVGSTDLTEITRAIEAEGTWLHTLRPDQVNDLASAAEYAQHTEAAEAAWQDELAYWTGDDHPAGTGIPASAIPAEPPLTPVPGRDFGRPGTMPISSGHDRSAVFALLYGRSDERADWLRAGEALSAGWLTAVEHGVTVLPLSAPVEVGSTRAVLRRLVADLGYPYLVLRLGKVDPVATRPPYSPRLPADQIIERTEG